MIPALDEKTLLTEVSATNLRERIDHTWNSGPEFQDRGVETCDGAHLWNLIKCLGHFLGNKVQ